MTIESAGRSARRTAPLSRQGPLLRRLLAQLRHVLRGEVRWLAAEARGDVIGERGDFRIGIGIAERRHRDGVGWGVPLGSVKHDLDDIDRTGIVDRPRSGDCGKGRD
jgi:hypothetical protein